MSKVYCHPRKAPKPWEGKDVAVLMPLVPTGMGAKESKAAVQKKDAGRETGLEKGRVVGECVDCVFLFVFLFRLFPTIS